MPLSVPANDERAVDSVTRRRDGDYPPERSRTGRTAASKALGMDRAALLRPGVTAHKAATEALHAMMQAGAERMSTPLYINFGVEMCMLHGRQSPKPLEHGPRLPAPLAKASMNAASSVQRSDRNDSICSPTGLPGPGWPGSPAARLSPGVPTATGPGSCRRVGAG